MSSSEMNPTPLVRRVQIGFASSSSSYSSTLLGKRPDEFADHFLPAARRLQRQPADADVAGHHALAGEHFEDAQDVFALAEAVEEHAHRADIERVRSQPHQVAVEPRKLGHHHARPLRARRNLDLQQLLDRQRVDQVVRKIRQIIDAIGQRHHLLPVLLLALLLDAGVQEADVGRGADEWSRLPVPARCAARRASTDAADPCSASCAAARPASPGSPAAAGIVAT